MISLTNALAYGAGMCGADELNARGKWVVNRSKVSARECLTQKNINQKNYQESWKWQASGRKNSVSRYCEHTRRYWVVDPNPPSHCLDLWNHNYTYFEEGPKLVRGQHPWETRWVEKR